MTNTIKLASNAMIVNQLTVVLKEAYNLASYDNEEVSIGTEALIYDDTSDFPIGGYAYATHVWEEGNCGVYHSIKWLENLLKEMVQAARQVHIKDAQEIKDITNELFMSKQQTGYYQFLCMDAYSTINQEDMDDTCKSIFKYVNNLSDHQCVIEFQQELMSDYEMEVLKDEARDMALNESDLEDLEMRTNEIMADLLYAKGK